MEYNPQGKPTEQDGPHASVDDTAMGGGPPELTPIESCNGLDDDEDGLVDEGYPDVDEDGVADCVDDTCVLDLERGGATADPETCEFEQTPPVAPWSVEPWWDRSTRYECNHTVAADLDGDGVVEVLCAGTVLEVISGLDGRTLWTTDAIADGSGLLVADVDADGSLDIVGFDADGNLLALEADGTPKWTSTAGFGATMWTEFVDLDLQVADLDADGLPEIIDHHGIVRGIDGSAVAPLDGDDDGALPLRHEIAVGDVDRDGRIDIFEDWRRYEADGTLDWDVSPSGWRYFATPLLVQADADDDAEILWISETGLLLVEPDGSTIWDYPTNGDASSWTLACAGDLDGDGTTEFVFNDTHFIRAWHLDGTELWSIPNDDWSDQWVGCTTFDFDLDGAREVIYSDAWHYYILDGRTGVALYTDATWVSPTSADLPLIVDLDGDGSADILASDPAGVGYGGVTYRAYRNTNRDWPRAGSLWPSVNWSGTSLRPDGSVPRTADAPWLTTGLWRGQPQSGPTGTDLQVTVSDVCVASCTDGPVRLAVRVSDLGPDETGAGTPVAVYAQDGDRTLLTVLFVVGWMDDGTVAPDIELDLSVEQARVGIEVVAGDDGRGAVTDDDCNTSNNSAFWNLTACGE